MYSIVVCALAFCSGFSIMAIELLGGRILAPWFGSGIYVWGSIITVFMLSLSVGYLIGGRLSVATPSLRRYALLFLCGGVTLLPLVLLGDVVLESVFDAVEDPRYGSLLTSIILFSVPTVILGMISPYSVRLLATSRDTAGQTAGVLYFVSTLGSAIGTLLTSFYLVAWFEINAIILSLMLLLVLCSLFAALYPAPYSERKLHK